MGSYHCPRCGKQFDKHELRLMCPDCGFQLSTYKFLKKAHSRKIIRIVKPFIITIVVIGAICGGLNYFSTICKIGRPGEDGGIIFFDKMHYSNGWRYLEVAPENLDPIYWSDTVNEKAVGEFVDGLGNGARDTYNVIYRYGAKSAAYKALNYGNTDDWYLGTRKEMSLLYFMTSNKFVKKIFKYRIKDIENFVLPDELSEEQKKAADYPLIYWTSELKNKTFVNCIDFNDGNQASIEYSKKCQVRPIRKF